MTMYKKAVEQLQLLQVPQLLETYVSTVSSGCKSRAYLGRRRGLFRKKMQKAITAAAIMVMAMFIDIVHNLGQLSI